MNLTDTQKTLPIVKTIRAALPTINYSFHSICSKYTFGDLYISDINETANLVYLTCSVRESLRVITMVFDGSSIHFIPIDHGWPALLDSSKPSLLKLQAKALGIAIAYVVKSISLFNYAVEYHRFQPIHSNLVAPAVNDRDGFVRIALNDMQSKSIVFNRSRLVFTAYSNQQKVISLDFTSLADTDLATYRKSIREAFDSVPV